MVRMISLVSSNDGRGRIDFLCVGGCSIGT